MNPIIIFGRKFFICLLFSFSAFVSAQKYGVDNILNFYTVDAPIYIPYGPKVIYQDFHTRIEIDVDSATFVSANYYKPEFAFDKNGIYYKGKYVDADTTGFRFLTSIYHQEQKLDIWKNQGYVYAGDSLLKNIDAETCVYLSNRILKDKNGFYKDLRKIADKKEIKKLLKEFSEEYEGIPYHVMIKSHSYYYKDEEGIYYFDMDSRENKLVPGADKNSFKDISNIGGSLGYDNGYLYIKDKRLEQIYTKGKVQLLGVYMGYRLYSEFDSSPIYNYFLIQTGYADYWMVSEKGVFSLGNEYPEHIINRSQKGKRKLIYF